MNSILYLFKNIIPSIMLRIILLSIFCSLLFLSVSFGQKKKESTPAYAPIDTSWFHGIEWRNIGPFRGGRSAAVTGVKGKPGLYYFGSTGGGVWRTQNGGQTWANISDKFFGGSIGAVEVSASDPNVIYAGGGEVTVRGNVSYGYGVWKTVDAGETWMHLGLDQSRQIARIRVNPNNPDIVYVAVLGDVFKDTKERGIYKSIDGGKTWKQVLFVNERAGVVDLIIDPNNSRILYASTWRVHRNPYELSSGGEGSALWKSKDSGETWENISKANGLPKGIWGISGITVSPVNSNLLYAIIENADGGVFKSTDGGKNWQLTNKDRNLRQRAWYYSRIFADPKSEDVVYVVNVSYHKSKDGGKTFSSNYTNHGDHHDLWIDPDNTQRMIMGDDGGAQVSFDGGDIWSTYHNQPTAQFYRVTTDNHFPYRIYGAQQDNSTVRISSRTGGGGISEADWDYTAGCESGYLAPDPMNDDIVYGGCYDGVLQRYDHKTGMTRNIEVWPDLPIGHGAEDLKYRFQWNFPIFFSPNNPKKLYTASNHLHVSTDEGQTWRVISPDLTRNDTAKLKPSGGPITKDNTSVEYYCTIFTAAESARQKGLLWTGSDDGLIHVSKDSGTTWTNVTPAFLPKWIQINSLEIDPHSEGGCYIAATMYKWGDYQPYLLSTKDYGQTWKMITTGIDTNHFTRVIRADPKVQGILYAGTESGMYISFDDGEHWQKMQLNLPIVPITDLTIKEDNLIAATQGRSFWILDELNQLRQLRNAKLKSFSVFNVSDFYRLTGASYKSQTEGTNYAGGLKMFYFLPDTLGKKDSISIFISDIKGDTAAFYSSKSKVNEFKLSPVKGINNFNWNLYYRPAKRVDGIMMWAGDESGPRAIPGKYNLDITMNDSTVHQTFTLKKDPRSSATDEDYRLYFDFTQEICDTMSAAHEAIVDIRDLRKQLMNYKELIKDDSIRKEIGKIDSIMTKVEEALYQTKLQSGQDMLNFPVRLNNKLAYLKTILDAGEDRPTQQQYEVRAVLESQLADQLAIFEKVKKEKIPALNKMIRDKGLEVIIVKE